MTWTLCKILATKEHYLKFFHCRVHRLPVHLFRHLPSLVTQNQLSIRNQIKHAPLSRCSIPFLPRGPALLGTRNNKLCSRFSSVLSIFFLPAFHLPQIPENLTIGGVSRARPALPSLGALPIRPLLSGSLALLFQVVMESFDISRLLFPKTLANLVCFASVTCFPWSLLPT